MSCNINQLMRLITDVRLDYSEELSNDCIESLIKTDNLLFDFKMNEHIKELLEEKIEGSQNND